jgi:5'-nucleotidase
MLDSWVSSLSVSHYGTDTLSDQNVNLPMSNATQCTNPSDYTFVLSRVNIDINPFTDDVDQCGTNHLPTESSVIAAGGCRVSVSVFNGWTKLDVDKETQAAVRDRIASLLTCLP